MPANHRTSLRRLGDWLLYIAISLVVLAAIVLAAQYGVPKDSFARWLRIIVFSLFVYGQFIGSSKQFWKNASFWALTGVAAVCHGVLVLAFATDFSTRSWIALSIVESMLLIGIRGLLIKKASRA